MALETTERVLLGGRGGQPGMGFINGALQRGDLDDDYDFLPDQLPMSAKERAAVATFER